MKGSASVGVMTLWIVCACSAPPDVPQPSLDGMEPQVAQKITRVRNDVVENADDASTWGKLGLVLEAHGLRAEARRCYEEASKRDPADYRWLYYQASLEKSELETALELATEAAAIAPESAPVLVLKASLEEQLGRSEASNRTYETLVGIDPSLAIAEFALGRSALTLRDYARAERHLSRAAELQPDAGAIHATLARMYRAQGDPDRAAESAALARTLEPDVDYPNPLMSAVISEGVSTRALQTRAQLEEAAGNLAAAESLHERLAVLQPADAEVHYNHANFTSRQGRGDDAERLYRRALALDESYVAAYVNLGNLFASRGELEAAIPLLRKAVELAPRDPTALVGLSSALSSRGGLEEAEALLERALEVAPNNLAALQGMSQTLAARGALGESADVLDTALREHPTDGRTHFLAALMAARLGDGEGARAHVEEAERLGFAVPEDFVAALRESFNVAR